MKRYVLLQIGVKINANVSNERLHMKETRNNCFVWKQRNLTLPMVKIHKHEYRKMAEALKISEILRFFFIIKCYFLFPFYVFKTICSHLYLLI